MRMSDKGLAVLKRLEGSRSGMYLDVAGLPTIGVGHLLTKDERSSGKILIGTEWIKWSNGLTEEQITELLSQDILPVEMVVDAYGPPTLEQHQFDALVSFTFNVGNSAFKRSTLLRKINQGQFDKVPAQFRRWKYAGSKVVQGLVNRREVEIKMWNGEYVS